jgi:HK97 family phage prohead protease
MRGETFRARVPFAVHTANSNAPVTFEGYASVFDTLIDAFMPTKIERGAFTATLADPEQRRRVKILWQHDTAEPIGKPLELREDSRGLFMRAQLSTTPRALEAAQLLRDQVVSDLSIGFNVGTFRIDRSGAEPVRHILELQLIEVSLVTFAANPQARITQVHQRADSPLTRAIADAERRWAAFQDWQLRDLELALLDISVPKVPR